MIDFWLILKDLLAFFAVVFMHELGHYGIAKYFGWKPSLGFDRAHFAFACYTHGVSLTIESQRDFLKVYRRLTAFGAMGIVTSISAIWTFFIVGLFPANLALSLMFLFTIYGISETCDPSVEITGEEGSK